MERGSQKQKYPLQLRAFALTLQLHSTKAYKYVRKTFDTSLPHPSTLRKWHQCIDGSPGFTKESLKALEMKAKEATKNNRKIFCALILDEIAI